MWTDKQDRNMNRRIFLGAGVALAFSASLLTSMPVLADQLTDLRKSGAVGEAYDGFARAKEASAKSFVQGVNGQRRKIYTKRAKSQGVSVDQIGRVYASQIAKKAPSGTWLLSESGKWSKKK